MERTTKEELIGSVAVDTGVVAIGDPCTYRGRQLRKHLTKYMANADDHGAVNLDRQFGPLLVYTPHGDGFFPVYRVTDADTGEYVGLTIRFDETVELAREGAPS